MKVIDKYGSLHLQGMTWKFPPEEIRQRGVVNLCINVLLRFNLFIYFNVFSEQNFAA